MGYMDSLVDKMMGGANKELAKATNAPAPAKPSISGPPPRPANANPNGTPVERKAYADWYAALQKYNASKKVVTK